MSDYLMDKTVNLKIWLCGLTVKSVNHVLAPREPCPISRPEVSFNYLGHVDRLLPDTPLLRLAKESIGHTHSREAARRHLFEIYASYLKGQFHMTWVYNEKIHHRSTIESLSQIYMSQIRSFIHQRDRGS